MSYQKMPRLKCVNHVCQHIQIFSIFLIEQFLRKRYIKLANLTWWVWSRPGGLKQQQR